jgi:hypothetical protein
MTQPKNKTWKKKNIHNIITFFQIFFVFNVSALLISTDLSSIASYSSGHGKMFEKIEKSDE